MHSSSGSHPGPPGPHLAAERLSGATTRLVNALGDDTVARCLVEEAAALLGADDVRLGLLEADGTTWILQEAIGPAAAYRRSRYERDVGIIGQVISHDEPHQRTVEPAPLLATPDGTEVGIGHVVAVPLRLKGELVGALLAHRPLEAPAFDAAERAALQVLANLAAARVGAATSFKNLRARAQDLAVLDPAWRPRPEEAGDFVIITHGRDTPFLDVDEAACRILGYPRESLLQRSMRDIFPMRPGSEHVDTLAAVRDQLLRGLPVTYDSTVRRRDGGLLPIRMTIQRVPGFEPPVYRTTFADLSHEKDAQARTLEQEKQRLLQEVGSAIAHELNTPLAVILGNIEIAREEFPEAALQDLLRPVQEAAERISSTVKRLQQFAKLIVPSGWASVDLSQLVGQVVEQTRPIWEAGPQATGQTIALELHVVPVPLVRAHAIELQEAVRELISNAVLAQPEGGTITISTGADDRWVWVSVRDTGVGMTDEVRQRCIDPFFTTRRPAAMGLGLNRVYHTVLQHRGRLQIESRPGAGTCVTISLPVVPEASTAAVVRGGGEARPT